MEASWLHKSDCRKRNLIIFCNGWGMDGHPFSALSSVDYDVYMLHDYRQLDNPPDVKAFAEKYQEIHLVSWSMGVWVGQKLFSGKEYLFHRTIAINGTLCPIHDNFGIPKKVFDATLADYGESARSKFYKRMCRDKVNLQIFLSRQPQRTVEDQAEELTALRKMADCLPVEESIYKEIIISDCDWVIPSANQFGFWQRGQVTSVSGFHFLFNRWQSWDHLLNFSDVVPLN
jgi:biotin synthesis protein BioG